MFRGRSKSGRVRELLLGAAAALCVLGMIAPAAAKPAGRPLLRLHRGTFDARAGAGLSVPAALTQAAPALTIIQFSAPITPADQAALRATGVEILEYLADYA